jgi:hypothetical protein
MDRLPDFIIGGAPRSGTTWLYHLLDGHPQISMAKPVSPEPKFFLVDRLYRRGLDYYARKWFSTYSDHCILGEKSTNYLESAVCARRIYKHLPHVKLIFILREPVARAFSNYLWSFNHGLETETFAKSLALEEPREQNLSEKFRYSRPHAYFSRGLYAKMLQPYYAQFSQSQILCLRYEDIAQQPRILAKRLYQFLSIDAIKSNAAEIGIINPSISHGRILSENCRKRLQNAYIQPNADLYRLLGPTFQKWEGSHE